VRSARFTSDFGGHISGNQIERSPRIEKRSIHFVYPERIQTLLCFSPQSRESFISAISFRLGIFKYPTLIQNFSHSQVAAAKTRMQALVIQAGICVGVWIFS
jgi:hypothetical protein